MAISSVWACPELLLPGRGSHGKAQYEANRVFQRPWSMRLGMHEALHATNTCGLDLEPSHTISKTHGCARKQERDDKVPGSAAQTARKPLPLAGWPAQGCVAAGLETLRDRFAPCAPAAPKWPSGWCQPREEGTP